uniref:Uncharacterized protein n=1 Tax=viral metagenome TaxID=1070528 RepID=A0A6C0D776_9ZZZZ
MSDYQPPKLQPQHLFEKREKRDKARLRAYNQLLEQIQHRIYTTSQLPGNPSYLVYNVPPFILGLPSMDLQDCIVYLVFQLRQNGFEIRFTYPNLLYISWASYEKEYFMKQNPIVQAMMPPKQEIINKKSKVSFTSSSKNDTIQNIYTNEVTVTPARSASDYEPPNAFLDTIQRPLPNQKSGASGAGNVVADLWNFS